MRYCMLQYDTISCEPIQYNNDIIKYNTICYNTIQDLRIQYHTLRYGMEGWMLDNLHCSPRTSGTSGTSDKTRGEEEGEREMKLERASHLSKYTTQVSSWLRYDTIGWNTIQYNTGRYDTMHYDTVRIWMPVHKEG